MRVVFDTNVVISGRLWSGSPKSALDAVYQNRATLLISEAMLDELKDVLSRPKFTRRLAQLEINAKEIVEDHLRFTEVIDASPLSSPASADPDDDLILACAVAGKADYVVTGDPHLLTLQKFEDISILTVTSFLEQVSLM